MKNNTHVTKHCTIQHGTGRAREEKRLINLTERQERAFSDEQQTAKDTEGNTKATW